MAQKLIRTSANLVASRLLSTRCCLASAQRRLSSGQASVVPNHKPESNLLLSEEDRRDFFRLNDLFSVEDLFRARVHFGHKEQVLNGHMRPYIFGKRLGVLIIDLDQTERLLKTALNVTAEIAYRNGIILFVCASRQTGHFVEKAAKECAVTRLPDLVVFFGTSESFNQTHRAVIMSAKLLIPTIGICDTNSNPTQITYPVPGNDDSPQSIEFYSHLFKAAVLNGKAKRKEVLDKYGEEFYNKTLEPT